MDEIRLKNEGHIWVGNSLLKFSATGFSLEKTSDPEQHEKRVHFYPESAESVIETLQKYVKVRDTLKELTAKNNPPT